MQFDPVLIGPFFSRVEACQEWRHSSEQVFSVTRPIFAHVKIDWFSYRGKDLRFVGDGFRAQLGFASLTPLQERILSLLSFWLFSELFESVEIDLFDDETPGSGKVLSETNSL